MDEIEKIYKFNFKDGINTKTMEKPNPSGITFYEENIKAVRNPHSNLVAITSSINNYRVSRLLINEGSALSLLYPQCWSKMELQYEFISKVVGFKGSTSKPYGLAMLNIELHGKVITIDFYLMNYNAPYNRLLGHDWMGKMGIVASLVYQCSKFPIGDMICKVCINRWHAFKCEEESFDQAQFNEVKGSTFYSLQIHNDQLTRSNVIYP